MLSGKLISIDIGSRYIHLAECTCKAVTVTVDRTVLVDAPVGAYGDGKIEEKDILKDVLHKALKENGIKNKEVVFTIQSSAVITRDATLPAMKAPELENAVKFEMEQYLPSIINGYYIEFKVLQEVTEGDVKKYRIRAAAIPADMADSYYQLARELKLNPIALDIHSNSISKLFSAGDEAVAVVDFGFSSTSINIISKGVLEFSRHIATGSRDLDMVIASRFDLPLDEAEQKKIKDVRLDQLAINPDSPEQADNQIYSIENALMSEIQKVFQFYTNRNRENRISAVYICGGGSNLNGLTEFMKTQLSIENVTQVKSTNKVVFNKNENGSTLEFFLNAVGALIRL